MRAFFLFLFALSTLFSNVVAVVSEADLPTCAVSRQQSRILRYIFLIDTASLLGNRDSCLNVFTQQHNLYM